MTESTALNVRPSPVEGSLLLVIDGHEDEDRRVCPRRSWKHFYIAGTVASIPRDCDNRACEVCGADWECRNLAHYKDAWREKAISMFFVEQGQRWDTVRKRLRRAGGEAVPVPMADGTYWVFTDWEPDLPHREADLSYFKEALRTMDMTRRLVPTKGWQVEAGKKSGQRIDAGEDGSDCIPLGVTKTVAPVLKASRALGYTVSREGRRWLIEGLPEPATPQFRLWLMACGLPVGHYEMKPLNRAA